MLDVPRMPPVRKTPWSDAWSACSIWQRNSSPHFYRGVQIPHKRKPREHLNIKRQNPTAHITTQRRVSHWESIDSFRNMFAKGLLSSPPSIRFYMNMIAHNCNSFWKCFTLSIWCITYRRNDSQRNLHICTQTVKNNKTLKFTVLGKTTIANKKSLQKQNIFLSVSLLLSHSVTTDSPSLSQPVSYTITHVRQGDNPSKGRGGGGGSIMGNVSGHMSKVQPVSWKKLCVVWQQSACPEPWTLLLHDSVQLRKKNSSCVQPAGEREQDRTSREGHQHYSTEINAFPLAVSVHCTDIVLRMNAEGFCVLQRTAKTERQWL